MACHPCPYHPCIIPPVPWKTPMSQPYSQRHSRSWPAILVPTILVSPASRHRPPSATQVHTILVCPASRPHPLCVTAGHGIPYFSIPSSYSQHRGIVLPASRQVMAFHSCPSSVMQVVAGQPRPPSVTVGRGRPSLSSQCHDRSWLPILVQSRPHLPCVKAGYGLLSSK